MANELKATVINMKTLSQDITDPVIVGAGDANGRVLRIIFTQEAAAQFTPSTKVYLSWWHQEKNIKGYNVFTEIKNEEDEDFPPTWEIHYPKSMLYEGNVLSCIQIVDEVSIATSVNFTIHVLIDPNDGSTFIASDDFTEFQKAIISLASVETQARRQLLNQKIEFEDMQLAFMKIQKNSNDAISIATEAKTIAESILGIATDAREVADEALTRTETISQTINEITDRVTALENETGVDEEQVINLIQDQLTDYATLGEVDEKLSVAIEEAQGKHHALWQALQFFDYSEDGE